MSLYRSVTKTGKLQPEVLCLHLRVESSEQSRKHLELDWVSVSYSYCLTSISICVHAKTVYIVSITCIDNE